jgi:hypothetical protein
MTMVLVVAGIMAVTVAVAMLFMQRSAARAQAAADQLRDEVAAAGEEWDIPLAGAVYQGGGSPAGRNKGHGVLGLTDRRVVFLPIAGEQLSVPRVRIIDARLEERRRDAAAATVAAAGHRHRLVLALDDETQLGFLVDEPAMWEQALAASRSSGGKG